MKVNFSFGMAEADIKSLILNTSGQSSTTLIVPSGLFNIFSNPTGVYTYGINVGAAASFYTFSLNNLGATTSYPNTTAGLESMMIDVMNNVTDAYLAKYVGDNRLDGTTVKLPTDFNTTNLIGTGSGHTGADVTYTYSTNTPVDKGIPLPAVTIPSFTIPGFTINKPTTGLTIKGYTIAQYHTVNSQVLGYTIPSYLLDTAGITVPGYTIPDLVIPAVPSLDPGVTPVMPANSYIAATGNAEPVSPTYSKSILYDEALSSWGSCDVPFKLLMDYSPVNARSINPITADVSWV